jgi:hypothetical protein
MNSSRACALTVRLEVIDVNDQECKRTPMIRRARELLFEQLEKLAAVVEIGQRIDRRELIDLLVIARLDRRAIHELEDAAADRDVIAVLEFGLDDRLVIEEGLVGRIEVLDPITRRLAPDLGMLPRNTAFEDLEFAFGRAADYQRRVADIDALAKTLTLQHYEAGRLAAGGEHARRPDGPALRGSVVVACGHGAWSAREWPESLREHMGAFAGAPGGSDQSGCRLRRNLYGHHGENGRSAPTFM